MAHRAQAEFTNRESAIHAFETSLKNVLHYNEHGFAKVLQFFGVGGIGKTRLINRLSDILKEQFPNALSLHVDFDDNSVVDPSRALLRLRRSARSENRVAFPVFDFAYSIYFAKRNPDFSFEERSIPYLEEASVVGDVISAIDGLGIVAAATGIISQAHKYSNRLSLPREAADALKALADMSEGRVADALPEFLAYDVNRHFDKKGGPVVIFLDTYERLWSEHLSEKDRFTKDEWIRKLTEGLTNALVVVCGREKIRWSEFDDRWVNRIEAHRVGRLSDEDTKKFLLSAGITDTNQINQILRVSNGHPFYLDLYLDMLHEEKGGSTRLPTDRRELFERFIRSLSEPETQLLKVLAPLSAYDQRFAADVVKEFSIALDFDQVERHLRFSFVKQAKYGFVIHEIMRRSIISHTSANFVEKVRRYVISNFGNRLDRANEKSADTEIVLPLGECARQLAEIGSVEDTCEWLQNRAEKPIRILQGRAATAPLIEAFSLLEGAVRKELWPLSIQIAYADTVHLTGRYEDAVNLLTSIIERKCDDGAQLLFAKVRRLHHSMMYRSTDEVWDEATILYEQEGSLYPGTPAHGELLFLLGGNLGVTMGSKAKAVPWLARALKWGGRNEDRTMVSRIYRKAADLYRVNGNLPKSKSYIEKGIAISDDLSQPRFLNYLLLSSADNMRLSQEYDSAIEISARTRRHFAEANMDGWLGHTWLLESAIAYDRSEYGKARETVDRAMTYYLRCGHKWGEMHCRVIGMKIDRDVGTDGHLHSELLHELKELGLHGLASWIKENAVVDGSAPALAFL